MSLLNERVWYITGAASGLGRATAELFAQSGALCVLMDINEDGRQIEKTLGPGKAFFAQCDATSEADVAQVIKSAKAKWPKARTAGLVYCSGISLGGLTVSNDGQPADLDIFKKVINVNLVGSYNAARLVAATIAQETGRSTEDNGLILLVSSASYQDPQPGLAAYAASKGGVASMVLSLSQDLARYGIRANAIAPSLFNTGMGASIPPGARQAIEKRFVHPKRIGEPHEFAHLAKAIAENQYINSTVIRLDGGTRMSKL